MRFVQFPFHTKDEKSLIELFLYAQALAVLFFRLIIQCKATHGAKNKNASIIRKVEKKDNINFP
ncbi:MAG TPA: hypothetical protein VNX68_14710, partial [Nitrosopumilaceae archaeon]|nr:hypothetical protein [Nitrosopumilaceae archaeon]